MNQSPSDSEETTPTVGPVTNPFSRFAFNPSGSHSSQTPTSKVRSPSPTARPSLGKRKGINVVEGEPPGINKNRKTSAKPSSSSKSAGPTPSKVKLYNHLDTIPDHLEANLDVVFCGIKAVDYAPFVHDRRDSPGKQSAQIGHHYGNPNNHFWSCLHESGLTSRRMNPREDSLLPQQYSIGLTNLVDRPTAQQNELSKQEQVAAVPSLLGKVSRYKPRIVCFVGLGIAEIVSSSASYGLQSSPLSGGAPNRTSQKAAVGLQTYKMVHTEPTASGDDNFETLFFAVSSTSGRVVRYQKADKVQQFRDLHDLVLKSKEGSVDTTPLTPILPPPSERHNTESQSSSSTGSSYVESLGSS